MNHVGAAAEPGGRTASKRPNASIARQVSPARPQPRSALRTAIEAALPAAVDTLHAGVLDGLDRAAAERRYGAAAGRPTPLIIMGNRQDELAWWKEQKDANGYKTMSVSIAPGVSTLAFWVAQQILDGQEVPKDLVVPFLRIDQDTLEANLESTPVGGVANVEYSQEDAMSFLEFPIKRYQFTLVAFALLVTRIPGIQNRYGVSDALLPVFLAAVLVQRFLGVSARIKRQMVWISRIAGALLVVVSGAILLSAKLAPRWTRSLSS